MFFFNNEYYFVCIIRKNKNLHTKKNEEKNDVVCSIWKSELAG